MFAAVFTFALATAYATELPSYINVCGRKNPNFNQCILDNVNNLRDKICNGFTDLGIPPLEPFNIDKLVISDSADSKVFLNDVKITGLCGYNVKSLIFDLDKLEITTEILFDRVYLNGTYDIDVHLLVPIVQKAPIYLTTDNAKISADLRLKMVNKGGKNRLYTSEVKTDVDINGYEAKYGFNDEDLGQMGQLIGGLIGTNQEEFLERLIPSLEEAISKFFMTISNGFFKTFTYDELFPDRE